MVSNWLQRSTPWRRARSRQLPSEGDPRLKATTSPALRSGTTATSELGTYSRVGTRALPPALGLRGSRTRLSRPRQILVEDERTSAAGTHIPRSSWQCPRRNDYHSAGAAPGAAPIPTRAVVKRIKANTSTPPRVINDPPATTGSRPALPESSMYSAALMITTPAT